MSNTLDQGQDDHHKIIRTSPSVTEVTIIQSDLTQSKKQKEQPTSSFNITEQWRKKQKSPNRLEQRDKNLNLENKQESWRGKKFEPNEYFKFGKTEKKYINSENRQQLNFKQNTENRQNRREGKKYEQNKYSDNGKNEKKNINNYSFGFIRLAELCCKDPYEIVFVMSYEVNGFMDLFKQNKEPDWLFLLMNVSAKICSTELIQSKYFLLTEIIGYQFFDHLKTYILSTPTEQNIKRCNNMSTFYEYCFVVFQSITTLFPKQAEEKLNELIIISNISINVIDSYCKHIEINKDTLSGINDLLKNLIKTKLPEDLKLKETSEHIAQPVPPPENIRELTVYPTAIDLDYGEPFLRPNISKGTFQNVEHYLDVQFRLLREDFIAPLREDIQFYKNTINNQCQKKIHNIRIYSDVEFEKKCEFGRDEYGYLINFDKKNKLKINWETTKRFMHGSLLLFSENDFKNFFLGTVMERKIDLLTEGKLIVQLLEDAKPLFNKSITMVESKLFFEPYKCSLEVLKNINTHKFPMEKYIISACNKIDYPYYIDELPEHTYYEIDDLVKFQVLSQNDWPTKDQLGLDEMQFGAFRAALTQEFTVIQGPPGTGKTFIGLKIMKTIISNLYENQFLTKPILVICYTNHALDQFMEGILSFTDKVVRIGGQSKSKILEKYSLRNISGNHRKTQTTYTCLKNIQNQLKNIMTNIIYFKKCSEAISNNAGILELSLLKICMPDQYHWCFKTTLDLLSWLFQDFDYFSVDPIGFITGISNELINRVYHSEKLLGIKKEDNNESIRYKLDDLDLEHNHKDINIYSITLDDINKACKELLQEIIRLENQSNISVHSFNDTEEAKFNFGIMENIHNYFDNMLNLADDDLDDDKILPRTIINLNALNMRQRWSLYFHWVKKTKDMFDQKILYFEQKYTQVYKHYAELKELSNVELLNKMHVVALTTTGAAKHRIMLEGLESPIVVVEEAAEVLEAHIVSSLTYHCQHLILIGDHKQLRPSNAVYKLAKDFNIDISLFERMVNNEVPCYTLGEQHRMRPEISSLIAPSIYDELKNHISVHNREHIRGVSKDVFFLNHNMHENEVEETTSKSNEHEAKFLIMFARHLILQGYKPDQVTILTTYNGQLFLIRLLRKKHSILEGIKITVVDNYQGEESDIILLSLVRSNEKGNVGFLKTDNRICVALSRAKYGLYIMGNMENLYNSGNLWKQIKETLINQGSYGDELTLECAIHSGITTTVAKCDDFNLIMEGGCSMMCNSLISCGHYCKSICHSYDREHLEFKCMEPCNKSCIYNHPCEKICFMDCGKCDVPLIKELPCGHQMTLPCFVDVLTFPCEEMLETILEECGHTILKKCHDQKPICTYKCIYRLDCGHACEKNCHKDDDPDHEKYKCFKPCENIHKKCSLNHKCQKMCYEDCSLYCDVKVQINLPCGHIKNDSPCGLKIDDIKCILPCDRPLKCDHKCQSKCYEICKPCEYQVINVIPECGHSITVKCKTITDRILCTKKCERILDCGHMCKKLCADECTNKDCEEIVLQKTSKLACGHNNVWVLCCDKYKEFRMDSQYLLDKCREPCLQKLNCNDICLGTCGECKQGRIHIPCSDICNKINPCNHICKFPCKERCPPCNQKCIYSCVHSICTLLCGYPCLPCKEKCEWKCPHLACTRKCHELCDRQPCYEHCTIKLKCGHECIGFCGEPCPPLCRICQEYEVTTIYFGNEDDPNARFIYLEDCEHIIESEALTKWMNQNDGEICLKQCPLCKAPIIRTQRFMNLVKLILKDISKIKIKQYEELSVIRSNTKTIINSLKSLDNNFVSNYICDTIYRFDRVKHLWHLFCKPILGSFGSKHSKFTLPAKDIESLNFVIYLFETIEKFYDRIEEINDSQRKQTIINHFDWILSVAFTYALQLSNQQKFDINTEMARGARIISLFEIMASKKFQITVTTQTSDINYIKKNVDDMENLLMSCSMYTLSKDQHIQHLTEKIQQKIDDVPFITDDERQMIHALMSTSFMGVGRDHGHWFKCSNGHIYCRIMAHQSINCPQCNE